MARLTLSGEGWGADLGPYNMEMEALKEQRLSWHASASSRHMHYELIHCISKSPARMFYCWWYLFLYWLPPAAWHKCFAEKFFVLKTRISRNLPVRPVDKDARSWKNCRDILGLVRQILTSLTLVFRDSNFVLHLHKPQPSVPLFLTTTLCQG